MLGSSRLPGTARRCYYWEKGGQRLQAQDILVVDEAGMLGSSQMARLLQEAESGRAKLVLIGDPQQLQAREAGAAFRAITERVPSLELTKVHRQKAAWQQDDQHNHLHAFATQALAKAALVTLWNEARIANPTHSQILLAYTRAEVQALNSQARECRQALGELGPNHLLATEDGEKAFALQDRVCFLKNDRSLGIMNGTLGTLTRIEGQQLTIRVDSTAWDKTNARSITFSIEEYPYLDHGYAATLHKAQGISVDRAYVLASRFLDAHAAYVGLSRHQESVDLFWSQQEFAEKPLSEILSRARTSVDYLKQDFAKVRGIENQKAEPQAFLAEFTRLQALVQKGGRTHYLAEQALKQLVNKVRRQPKLMQALRLEHSLIAQQIDMLHKSLCERGLER